MNSCSLCSASFAKRPGCQISVTLMSWDGWWVDLGLFTTQFSDKVLLDTWI